MSLNPNAGSVTWIGIKKETAYGTYVAPYLWIRCSKIADKDVHTPLFDETMQGDYLDKHQSVPGTIHSEIDFTGPVELDTVGYIFGGVLGAATWTTGSPANTILFNASTAYPPSYSVTILKQGVIRAYAGCYFSEATVSGAADKLCEVSGKLLGQPQSSQSAPTVSWTAELPVQTWASNYKCGDNAGAAATIYADTWEYNFKRDVKPIFSATGLRTPSSFYLGPISSDGKATVAANGTTITEITDYAAGTSRYTSVLLTGAVTGESLLIETLNAVYTGAEIKADPKDYVKHDLTFDLVGAVTTTAVSPAVLSPAQVTLLNVTPIGTYA